MIASVVALALMTSTAVSPTEQRAIDHQVLQWILVQQRPDVGFLGALPEATDFPRSEKPERVWSLLEKSVDGSLWMLPEKQPLDDTLAVCSEKRANADERLVRVVFGNALKPAEALVVEVPVRWNAETKRVVPLDAPKKRAMPRVKAIAAACRRIQLVATTGRLADDEGPLVAAARAKGSPGVRLAAGDENAQIDALVAKTAELLPELVKPTWTLLDVLAGGADILAARDDVTKEPEERLSLLQTARMTQFLGMGQKQMPLAQVHGAIVELTKTGTTVVLVDDIARQTKGIVVTWIARGDGVFVLHRVPGTIDLETGTNAPNVTYVFYARGDGGTWRRIDNPNVKSEARRALENHVALWVTSLVEAVEGSADALPSPADFARDEKPARVLELIDSAVDGDYRLHLDKLVPAKSGVEPRRVVTAVCSPRGDDARNARAASVPVRVLFHEVDTREDAKELGPLALVVEARVRWDATKKRAVPTAPLTRKYMSLYKGAGKNPGAYDPTCRSLFVERARLHDDRGPIVVAAAARTPGVSVKNEAELVARTHALLPEFFEPTWTLLDALADARDLRELAGVRTLTRMGIAVGTPVGEEYLVMERRRQLLNFQANAPTFAKIARAWVVTNAGVTNLAMTSVASPNMGIATVTWLSRGDGVHVLASVPFGIPGLPGTQVADAATEYEKKGDVWTPVEKK